jgi:hypothetical protein
MAFGDVPASDKLAVQFPDRNDPRQPKLMFEDLDKSPVWLRFVPANADDEWNVDFVQVIVKAGSKTQTYEALPHPNDTLWLGNKGGLYLNLSKVT